MAQLWPDQRLHFDSRAIFIPDMGEQGEQRGNGHVPQRSQVARVVQDLSTPHNTQAVYVTDRRIKSVGLFLVSFARTKGMSGTPGTVDEKGKSLKSRRLRYHSGPIKKDCPLGSGIGQPPLHCVAKELTICAVSTLRSKCADFL